MLILFFQSWIVDFAGGYVSQFSDKMMAHFCGRLFINLTVSKWKK